MDQSKRNHQKQAAGMRDCGQQERIGAPRGVPADKITGSPGEDSTQAEAGGYEQGWQSHSQLIFRSK